MLMYLDTLKSPLHGSRNSPLPEYKCNRRPKLSELLILSSDELVPPPTKVEQNDITTSSRVLFNHPLFTHTPKNALFPVFTLDKTNSVRNGCVPQSAKPSHAEWPNRPHSVNYREKCRGGRWFHEVWKCEDCSQSTDRDWIEWPEVRKDRPLQDMNYYPTPPKLNVPNDSRPNVEIMSQMSPREMEVLQNIQKEQWLTTYRREFTGNGPLGAINLDDWHLKREAYLQDGKFVDELTPISKTRFDPTKSTFLGSSKGKHRTSFNDDLQPQLKRSNTLATMQERGSQLEMQWTPQYRSYEPLPTATKPEYPANVFPRSSNEFHNINYVNSNESSPDIYQIYSQQLYEVENSHSRNVNSHPNEFIFYSTIGKTTSPIIDENVSYSSNQRDNIFYSSFTSDNVTKLKPVNLLQLKRSFNRSAVRDQFLTTFPDRKVDLRDHIETGKRHFSPQIL